METKRDSFDRKPVLRKRIGGNRIARLGVAVMNDRNRSDYDKIIESKLVECFRGKKIFS